MIDETAAEPLHEIIRNVRCPATLRELMAVCLRSIYNGTPFTKSESQFPVLGRDLIDEVVVREADCGGIRCVIYMPRSTSAKRPLILYMHGGGFVVGCSEDTDYTTRRLCFDNQCIVISVNYRLAPETVFPGALDDCQRVLDWAVDQSSQLDADSSEIYLAGDSAGGNLAMALSHRLRQRGSSISGLILLAPWLDMEVEAYDSYNRLAPTGVVFDAAFLGYARGAYVGFENWKNPLASPLFLESLADLPRTVVLVGTADPLLDQSLKLKQLALESASEQVAVHTYANMPHCFYSFPNLFIEEVDCYRTIKAFIGGK